MSDILFFNGRFTTTAEPVISVEDRGFQFGDAVYEVFKFHGRRPVFLADHFRRLDGGLRALEIPNPWTEATFHETMDELLRRTDFDDGIVYIQVTRGVAERAHFYPEGMQPTVLAYSRRFRFPDEAKRGAGIRVITRPDLRWKRCDIKSVNLLANALVKKEAQRAGADEALLVEDGEVHEGASSSFFLVAGRTVVTHPSAACLLPGTIRDHVVALAREHGLGVEERAIGEAELRGAGEAFITSTTMGVMPVVAIDGRAVGEGRRGSVTATLQRALIELERRDLERR